MSISIIATASSTKNGNQWTATKESVMGDKGGKKDKDKSRKQKASVQDKKTKNAKEKQDKQKSVAK